MIICLVLSLVSNRECSPKPAFSGQSVHGRFLGNRFTVIFLLESTASNRECSPKPAFSWQSMHGDLFKGWAAHKPIRSRAEPTCSRISVHSHFPGILFGAIFLVQICNFYGRVFPQTDIFQAICSQQSVHVYLFIQIYRFCLRMFPEDHLFRPILSRPLFREHVRSHLLIKADYFEQRMLP